MSKKIYTLYYTPFSIYEACPQQYLWARGWGEIDVGGGPGKKKPLPRKKSEHHKVMGIVIQAVIERMYNDRLWELFRGQKEKFREMLLNLTDRLFEDELAKAYVPWGSMGVPSREELKEVCYDGVLGYLNTMRVNGFVGSYMRAEVDLLGYVDKYTPIGGRADLIIKGKDGTIILDGKNSASKGKYTSPDQLRWYALCLKVAFNKYPDRLGFVYYRYPANSEGESGVEWVDFTEEEIQDLARRAIAARKGMHYEKFEPTPSAPVCRLCDYEAVCEARQLQKNARKRKTTLNLESKFTDGQYVVSLSLDED